MSLQSVGDSFTTRQPRGNSHSPCIKWVTIVIYYQSGRGVNEYCGHRHNGAAVTGHSTQLAPPPSREGLALADATVGSFRRKVMDTEV